MGIIQQDATFSTTSITTYPYKNDTPTQRQPAKAENLMAREIQNMINTSGQTSSESNHKQITNAINTLIANSNLYNTNGTADAIILTARTLNSANLDTLQIPNLHFDEDGAKYEFNANFTNTTSVTIEISGFISSSSVVDSFGAVLKVGTIITGNRYTVVRDKTNSRFILLNSVPQLEIKRPTFSYNTITTLNYSAGVIKFENDNYTNSIEAGTINLATVGLGGLDTGALVLNTTYHVFAIQDPATGVISTITSASLLNPILPTGFTKKMLIYRFLVNALGQIRPFVQVGNKTIYNAPVVHPPITAVSTPTLYNVEIPAGEDFEGVFSIQASLPGGGGAFGILLSHGAGVVATVTNCDLTNFYLTGVPTIWGMSNIFVKVSTSSTIYMSGYFTVTVANTTTVTTKAFIDYKL